MHNINLGIIDLKRLCTVAVYTPQLRFTIVVHPYCKPNEYLIKNVDSIKYPIFDS